jgi:hypothetical protein
MPHDFEKQQTAASDADPKKPARKSRTAKRSAEEPGLPIPNASDGVSSDDGGLEADIRRCAYDLYVARGGVGGDAVSDWLEAERMVRRTR